MSNLWLNIRLFLWHLQTGEPKWYSFTISRNDYHKGNKKWFEIYKFSPFK